MNSARILGVAALVAGGILFSCGAPSSVDGGTGGAAGTGGGQATGGGGSSGTGGGLNTGGGTGTGGGVASGCGTNSGDGGFFTSGTMSAVVDGVLVDLSTNVSGHCRQSLTVNSLTGTAMGIQPIASIQFPGTAPAVFNCAALSSLVTLGYNNAAGFFYAGPGDTCRIEISAYGAIGEPIMGTFSGVLHTVTGDAGTLTITDGGFHIIRGSNN